MVEKHHHNILELQKFHTLLKVVPFLILLGT
jgi:hypothetical protein